MCDRDRTDDEREAQQHDELRPLADCLDHRRHGEVLASLEDRDLNGAVHPEDDAGAEQQERYGPVIPWAATRELPQENDHEPHQRQRGATSPEQPPYRCALSDVSRSCNVALRRVGQAQSAQLDQRRCQPSEVDVGTVLPRHQEEWDQQPGEGPAHNLEAPGEDVLSALAEEAHLRPTGPSHVFTAW